MAIHNRANCTWTIPDGVIGRDQAQLAVLMDIRFELQSLNALLHCHNFTGIPQVLRSIKRNTTKAKRRKPKTP